MSIRDFDNTNILLPPLFIKDIKVSIIGNHRKIYDICTKFGEKTSRKNTGINILTKINRQRQVLNIPLPKKNEKNVNSMLLWNNICKNTKRNFLTMV